MLGGWGRLTSTAPKPPLPVFGQVPLDALKLARYVSPGASRLAVQEVWAAGHPALTACGDRLLLAPPG